MMSSSIHALRSYMLRCECVLAELLQLKEQSARELGIKRCECGFQDVVRVKIATALVLEMQH